MGKNIKYFPFFKSSFLLITVLANPVEWTENDYRGLPNAHIINLNPFFVSLAMCAFCAPAHERERKDVVNACARGNSKFTQNNILKQDNSRLYLASFIDEIFDIYHKNLFVTVTQQNYLYIFFENMHILAIFTSERERKDI